MASGKRRAGESFKLYRARLKAQAFEEKFFLKGRVIWDSLWLGTYVRPRHKAIGR